MAKVKPVEKEEKKTEVKEEESAKELEHEVNLKRLNPDFDPDLPEQKQRHLRT